MSDHTQSFMEEVASMAWPDPYAKSENAAKPEMVLRYERNWDHKLFPVSCAIQKAGVGTDRWPLDRYDVEITESNAILVINKATGFVAQAYNANRWLQYGLEYNDGHSWHDVSIGHGLKLMSKEEADAGKS